MATYEPNLSDVERGFFDRVAPWLALFARRHNLRLEEWFKDVGIWSLQFQHPRGGHGRVDVQPSPAGEAVIDSYWTRDDYDSETRFGAYNPRESIPAEEKAVLVKLERELARVLAWTESDFHEPARMTPGMWHRHFTRDDFGERERSLPVPRLEDTDAG
jgi:hypothetical protein